MPKLPANIYSSSWFEAFHISIPRVRTEREVDFICAIGPLPEFQSILDVCCGMGRHARALARRGYAVTGIEREAVAITRARELGGGPVYVQSDIREYSPERASCDLVICMSQSFGYFDDATNRDLLQKFAHSLRPGGRLLLDLWNPEFFFSHQGGREFQTPAGVVRENKRIEDDRLIVDLLYADGTAGNFEWQLFSPRQMEEVAGSVGLCLFRTCVDFDLSVAPKPDVPRIQFALERVPAA